MLVDTDSHQHVTALWVQKRGAVAVAVVPEVLEQMHQRRVPAQVALVETQRLPAHLKLMQVVVVVRAV